MTDRIRYYRVRNGNAFWEPGRQADEFTLPRSQALGPDGVDAKTKALEWNAKLDLAREGIPPTPTYTEGSLAHFYDVFKTKDAWAQMAHRTREDDYERVWPTIEKRHDMGVCVPRAGVVIGPQ